MNVVLALNTYQKFKIGKPTLTSDTVNCGMFNLCKSLTAGSGQQCCYDSGGDIIVGPPGGGTFDLVSPDVSFTEHFLQDVLPFWLCCKAGFFSNCGRYYQSRPSDDCSRYVPPPPPGMFFISVWEHHQ